jgi:hypothetical protein
VITLGPMRRLSAFLACAGVLAGLAATSVTAAPAHSQKLTPLEQKWVTPMITVWNAMNAGLHLFYKQATAKDALIPGSANNLPLTKTLAVFIECSPVVKKLGAPPSPRLQPFADSLAKSCVHLGNGAHDLAKGIGALGKGNKKLGNSLIGKVGLELKQATALLGQAQHRLIAVGGKNIFTA